MFGFLKKNKVPAEPPLAKKAKTMPYSKKVQFCYLKPAELTAQLDEDINSVLTLTPVNYYAEKNRYYQCVFYYNDDYSEILMNFELYENDIKKSSTAFYSIDMELYSKILLKFGQKPINYR
jgi:hypothetical protein